MSKLRKSLVALTGLALVAAAVIISTPAGADNGPEHKVRNLNFGVSGGNVNDISRRFCCSGTLGALIQDTNGTQYILSNNHVLGLADQAQPGDDVSQPGRIDANCQVTTVVADFTTAPPLTQNVDAAIAELRPGLMNSTGEIEDIGTISSAIRSPAVGLSVQKSGRTTGHTTGSITSISTTVSIRYPKSCGAGGGTVRTFTNQVVITPGTFSAGGDSGSLIVSNDANRQPVALLFAGSSSSTIGNPIGEVMSRISTRLGRTVSFVGGGGTSSAQSASLGYSITPEGQIMQHLPEVAADAARAALARNEAGLMSRADVLGVGIGQAADNATEAVIVIYVNKDTPGAGRNLPREIDGVRVRRVMTDEFVAR